MIRLYRFVYILICIFFILLSAICIFFFKRWLGPLGSFVIIVVSLFISLIYSCFLFTQLQRLSIIYFFDFGYWLLIDELIESHLVFLCDSLGLVFSILVLMLSLFVQFFSVEYMYREAYLTRLLYLLQFFISSVLFLFIVFDFFLILVAWELIGLFSLLLVNFYSTRVYTLKAALKTFLFSRLSDFFIFLLFVLFVYIFNSSDLSVIFLELPFFLFYTVFILNFGLPLPLVIGFFLVVSGGIKGAQLGAHVWLPDAMEAPTPASALIHSSTLVIMGIYLILRFGLILELSPPVSYFLIYWGSMTLFLGSVSATFQTDIKKLVAYSTISQMGYLFCGCGYLCFHEVSFYLIVHAFSKAFLFICVGYIVNFFSHNTDMRFMGGFYFYGKDVFFFTCFVSINLAGLPYSAGFISKEFLIFQTFVSSWVFSITKFCWFFSFFFTPVYLLMLVYNVFFYMKPTLFIFNLDLTSFVSNHPLHVVNYMFSRLERSFVYSRLSSIIFLTLLLVIFFGGESIIVYLGGCGASKLLTEFTSILPSSFLWWSHCFTSSFWFIMLQQVSLILLLLGLKYFFFLTRL